jgi:hypothetical protein
MKVTPNELKLARRAGFRRSKPSKPKGKFTENKFNNYVERYNTWAKEVKSAAKEGRKLESARERLVRMKTTLSGL